MIEDLTPLDKIEAKTQKANEFLQELKIELATQQGSPEAAALAEMKFFTENEREVQSDALRRQLTGKIEENFLFKIPIISSLVAPIKPWIGHTFDVMGLFKVDRSGRPLHAKTLNKFQKSNNPFTAFSLIWTALFGRFKKKPKLPEQETIDTYSAHMPAFELESSETHTTVNNSTHRFVLNKNERQITYTTGEHTYELQAERLGIDMAAWDPGKVDLELDPNNQPVLKIGKKKRLSLAEIPLFTQIHDTPDKIEVAGGDGWFGKKLVFEQKDRAPEQAATDATEDAEEAVATGTEQSEEEAETTPG